MSRRMSASGGPPCETAGTGRRHDRSLSTGGARGLALPRRSTQRIDPAFRGRLARIWARASVRARRSLRISTLPPLALRPQSRAWIRPGLLNTSRSSAPKIEEFTKAVVADAPAAAVQPQQAAGTARAGMLGDQLGGQLVAEISALHETGRADEPPLPECPAPRQSSGLLRRKPADRAG